MQRPNKNPTDWKIKGELILNCSCDVFFPCVVSLGAHPATEGHCHAWMGSEVIVAKGKQSRVRDYGRVWDFDGKSAEICPIQWAGP